MAGGERLVALCASLGICSRKEAARCSTWHVLVSIAHLIARGALTSGCPRVMAGPKGPGPFGHRTGHIGQGHQAA